jgi:hypothetical protein
MSLLYCPAEQTQLDNTNRPDPILKIAGLCAGADPIEETQTKTHRHGHMLVVVDIVKSVWVAMFLEDLNNKNRGNACDRYHEQVVEV